MYVNCEALVLRHLRFSETSLVVSLYTREYGRVDALAKGARRPGSPMRGHFDLFAREEVTLFLRPRAGLDLATEAGLVREHTGLRERPERFAAAGILAELLLSGSMAHDPHPAAFEIVAQTLESLSGGAQGYQPLIAGVLAVLREFGFLPRLESCPVCRVVAPRAGSLSGRHGGLLCPDCAGRLPRLPRLRSAEVAALRYLLQGCRPEDGGAGFWRLPLLPGRSEGHGAERPVADVTSGHNLRREHLRTKATLALSPQQGAEIVQALGEYCRVVLDKPCRSFAFFATLTARQRALPVSVVAEG